MPEKGPKNICIYLYPFFFLFLKVNTYLEEEIDNEKNVKKKSLGIIFLRRSSSEPAPDATRALSFGVHGGLFRRDGSLSLEEFKFLLKCFHCLKLLS